MPTCIVVGKTQRKFVLLGRPAQKVAAVIVEANKFAFIYHSVASSAANGTHQVRRRLQYSDRVNALVCLPSSRCIL